MIVMVEWIFLTRSLTSFLVGRDRNDLGTHERISCCSISRAPARVRHQEGLCQIEKHHLAGHDRISLVPQTHNTRSMNDERMALIKLHENQVSTHAGSLKNRCLRFASHLYRGWEAIYQQFRNSPACMRILALYSTNVIRRKRVLSEESDDDDGVSSQLLSGLPTHQPSSHQLASSLRLYVHLDVTRMIRQGTTSSRF